MEMVRILRVNWREMYLHRKIVHHLYLPSLNYLELNKNKQAGVRNVEAKTQRHLRFFYLRSHCRIWKVHAYLLFQLLFILKMFPTVGEQTFEHVLEKSFDVSSVTPAWCEICQKYQATQQRRRCLTLPPVLALSCANDTYKGFRFWSDQLQVRFTLVNIFGQVANFHHFSFSTC